MKLLVTGAGGFVGAAVVREAMERGYAAVGTIRPGGRGHRLATTRSGLLIEEVDLRDQNGMASVMQRHRPDVIIHAGWSGVSNKARNHPSQISDNIDAACNLVDAGAKFGVSKFVGIGSQGEYGLLSGRIDETALPSPTSLYGASKLAVMHLTQQLAADAGMAFAWLRLFSTYGPDDNPHWLIPSLIEEMLSGNRPRTTLGTQLWDYLFIGDVARGILGAATTGDATGVFNLGSGQPVAIRHLVERIRDFVAPQMELVFGDIPYRGDQIWHMEADVSRLKKLAKWSPQVDLDSGLRLTIDWHKEQRNPRAVPVPLPASEANLASLLSMARSRGSLRRFALFLVVGLLNTLVGYGIFAAMVFVGAIPELALLGATVLGVAFNFFTTGRIVFADSSAKRFVRFVAVYALVYAVNALALRLLIIAGMSAIVGQFLLLPISVLLTFLMLRTFVFQGTSQ